MSSTASHAVPSLAQRLPPEVLDHILSIHFSKKHYGYEKTGKGLSLVCRNWSGPVQRLLFQTVTVTSVVTLHELGRVKTTLGEVVRSLNVEIYGDRIKWKIRELNDVLDTLPLLTSLTLYLTSSSPGYQGSYAALKQLPNLKTLNLQSEKYDSNMVSCRQILAATPNITRLTLGVTQTSPRDSYTRPNKTREPIDLAHLTRLALHGIHLCYTFQELKLFTDATFARIDDVELDEMTQYSRGMRRHSLQKLVEFLGPKIKTMRLGQSELSMRDLNLLPICRNIETIVCERAIHDGIANLTSLRTVKFYSPYESNGCQWINWASRTEYLLDCPSIARFEIYDARPVEVVKNFIVTKGVELVIDGVVYVPATSSN